MREVAVSDAEEQYPLSAAVAVVEHAARLLAHESNDAEAIGADDLLAALAGLHAAQDQLAALEPLLIGAARDRGVSWAAIAPAIGVASRQAAERRYLRLNPHATDPAGITGEQRLQAARDRRAGQRAVAEWARANASRLRRLAAHITALEGLTPAGQASVDKVLDALGDADSANLLQPLTDAGAQLQRSHPAVAQEVSDLNATTEDIRQSGNKSQ